MMFKRNLWRGPAMLLALVGAAGCLALAPGSASAATNQFTCSASALRVTALGAVNVEPEVANAANDPCATGSAQTAAISVPGLLSTGVASASTASSASTGSATGQVAGVNLALLGISATVANSTANATCTAGIPAFSSNSTIVGLSVGGTPITVSGQQVPLGPLGTLGVATVNIDETINTGSGVTQRAVDITIAGGLDGGAQIVLGEASAGADGNPCTTSGGGTGGGGPIGGGPGGGGPPSGSLPGVPGSPTDVSLPVITGNPLPGDQLRCLPGQWTGDPSRYSYAWYLDGAPIAGANGASYTVTISDEASSPSDVLQCVVTAYNTAGASTPVASRGVPVAVKGTQRCKRPTGQLNGSRLGLLRLGMTQRTARHRLPRYAVTRNGFDNFCLYAGWGIRAAYPTKALLKATHAYNLRGRIVIALTANPFYRLEGTAPGAKVTKALSKHLRLTKPFHIGSNYWYVVPETHSRGLLKVRHGVVHEVGVISRQLSNGRKAQSRLLHSFPNLA
jgi:hypothetical protein